jgi:hypothetical protein
MSSFTRGYGRWRAAAACYHGGEISNSWDASQWLLCEPVPQLAGCLLVQAQRHLRRA